MLAQAAPSAFQQGLPAIGPELQRHFGIDLVQTGALLSAASFGVALTMVGWGILADRIGERAVLAVGLGGSAAALAAAALAPSYWPLVLALVVAGMFCASANAASGRAVMAWFGRHERGLALGIRQMATPLGGAAGAAVLPPIVLAGGIAPGFWAAAAFSGAAAAVCAIVLRRAAGARPASLGRSPIRDRRLWRLALGGAFIVMAQLSLVAYLVIYLNEDRHLPLATAALALTAAQVAGAGLRVLAGAWSDRAGSRLRPMRRMGVVGALLLAGMALLAGAPAAVVIVLGAATTAANMSTNGLAFTATGELAGAVRAGTAMGFQNTWLFVAGVAGPIAFGVVVSRFGWHVGFATLCALAGAGVLLLGPLIPEEARGWRAE